MLPLGYRHDFGDNQPFEAQREIVLSAFALGHAAGPVPFFKGRARRRTRGTSALAGLETRVGILLGLAAGRHRVSDAARP